MTAEERDVYKRQAEKRELLRKLSLMITDRRDKKKLEDIVDNDPEMWCLDKIMNKDEVKFMLSFEKKRVNKRCV